MNYWDSSALVKLYLAEPGQTDLVSLSHAEPRIATSSLSLVEVCAAMAAALRGGRLTARVHADALRLFGDRWEEITAIRPADALLAAAAERAVRFGLRALDAVHLASLEVLGRDTGSTVQFVGFDRALNRAARKLGYGLPAFAPD